MSFEALFLIALFFIVSLFWFSIGMLVGALVW